MTLDIHIDGDKAIDLLAHRVKDHEDFVYTMFQTAPSCRYEFGGCPSCLIGGVLFDAGVPVEQLAKLDIVRPIPDGDGIEGQVDGTAINEVVLPKGLTLTPKALTILKVAQRAQDLGETWGRAFEFAVHASREFGSER